ncbi:NAD(P)H-dependent oxidoreductase [Alcanivorax sp. JB21]|uniref:NADPH-dependent FMN reductase n=1 Tax=Alcanivorax limicola TaxID=2874102 RepID=UPI001CBB7614|nr:NAD(P)H-dependent oxidoreductase [Alcanivorax limicola]MBZ2187485.1 NAD(P)H-dependent oxidoreductase [Alcanivorax limicola]
MTTDTPPGNSTDNATNNPADTPRILAFAGSARSASLNKQLARAAAESARRQGADVTLVDLRDYPAPLYDGDLEEKHGIPPAIRQLKTLFAAHHGLMIASPEYNGFITPLLKNTLDWISRSDGDASGLALFEDKLAVILAASPGALGGMRSLQTVRQLLTNLGVLVLPNQVSVPRAGQAFDDTGQLTDAALNKRLDNACAALCRHLRCLQA